MRQDETSQEYSDRRLMEIARAFGLLQGATQNAISDLNCRGLRWEAQELKAGLERALAAFKGDEN